MKRFSYTYKTIAIRLGSFAHKKNSLPVAGSDIQLKKSKELYEQNIGPIVALVLS